MNFDSIIEIVEIEKMIADNVGVLIYFSTLSCSVGEALEPKVLKLIDRNFPKIDTCLVDINSSPKIAAKYSVFVEPTILVFFEGKETIRRSRNIGIYDLSKSISRVYDMVFN